MLVGKGFDGGEKKSGSRGEGASNLICSLLKNKTVCTGQEKKNEKTNEEHQELFFSRIKFYSDVN